MNISLWRAGLKTWLNQYLVVDSWDLRNPVEYLKTNGFIPPLQGINYLSDQAGSCNANQDFYLTIRYPSGFRYDDLPIGTFEQLYTNIHQRLALTYSSLAPMLDFQMLSVPDCIQVVEYGDDLADWLVTLVFSCNITWVHTPTLLPGQIDTPLPNITRIDCGLFTEHLASKSHLDPTQRDKVGIVRVTKT